MNGIELGASDRNPVPAFFYDFGRSGVERLDYAGQERILFADNFKELTLAAIFTNKGHNEYVTVEQDNSGRLRVKIEATIGEKPMFDFTFLCVKRSSGVGL